MAGAKGRGVSLAGETNLLKLIHDESFSTQEPGGAPRPSNTPLSHDQASVPSRAAPMIVLDLRSVPPPPALGDLPDALLGVLPAGRGHSQPQASRRWESQARDHSKDRGYRRKVSSALTHKSRTRGIVEFLLVFLRIRPNRCEACDLRFLPVVCSTQTHGHAVGEDNECPGPSPTHSARGIQWWLRAAC